MTEGFFGTWHSLIITSAHAQRGVKCSLGRRPVMFPGTVQAGPWTSSDMLAIGVLILCVCVLVCNCSASAGMEDWLGWRGPHTLTSDGATHTHMHSSTLSLLEIIMTELAGMSREL